MAETLKIPYGPYTVKDFKDKTSDNRAELVNGNIIMLAAPSIEHQRISSKISYQIQDYVYKSNGGCDVFSSPIDVQLDERNVFEPDITVICDKEKLDNQTCNGAPDWVIEIVSPSTAKNDYVLKLNAYGEAGVREYWIVDPRNKMVNVFIFEKNGFQPDVYHFTDKIPVAIYEGNLKITIE